MLGRLRDLEGARSALGAERAVRDLLNRGFARDDISVVANNAAGIRTGCLVTLGTATFISLAAAQAGDRRLKPAGWDQHAAPRVAVRPCRK